MYRKVEGKGETATKKSHKLEISLVSHYYVFKTPIIRLFQELSPILTAVAVVAFFLGDFSLILNGS